MKKHLRKIPEYIREKVKNFQDENIVVQTILSIKASDIANPKYSQLGLSLDDGNLVFNNELVPDTKMGPYSRRNIKGYSYPLKDKPKIYKTYYAGERPIFGDSSKGYFSLYITRLVYQRVIYAPKELSIKIELIDTKDIPEKEYILRIYVDHVLNRGLPTFDFDLLFDLNLLQENIGISDVFESSTKVEDYIKTLYVGWEIFPDGNRDQIVEAVLKGIRKPSPELIKVIEDRNEFINSLKPINRIVGVSQNKRYFGARFSDNIVVFENVMYGNAIYVLFEDWSEVSKLSRTEILSLPEDKYIRIVHNKNWKHALQTLLKERLAAKTI